MVSGPEETFAQRFGRNLIRLRKQAGVSQEELGFIASLHRTEIGMLERGARIARADTILKLAGALEVSPGDFFAGMVYRPVLIARSGGFEMQGEEEAMSL